MQNNSTKRFFAYILCICMVFTMSFGTAFADTDPVDTALDQKLIASQDLAQKGEFADTKGHWAEQKIARWSGYGIVNGYEMPDGSESIFMPDNLMTRAEGATIFVNLFGLKEMADISKFDDVAKGEWHHDAMAKCVKAGILNGTGKGLEPKAPMTREQMMVMFGRALNLEEEASAVKHIPDGGKVSSWAAGMINAMINKGFISGLEDGSIAPQNLINRAGMMSLVDQTIGSYANEPGTIEAAKEGITLVVADGVTVIGNADTLVVASSSTTTRVMGSVDSINIVGPEDVVIITSEAKNVENVKISGEKASLEVEKGAKVDNVEITKDAEGAKVSGEGEVAKVDTKADNTKIDTKDTDLTVAPGVEGTTAQGKEIEAPKVDPANPTTDPQTPQEPAKPSSSGKSKPKLTDEQVVAKAKETMLKELIGLETIELGTFIDQADIDAATGETGLDKVKDYLENVVKEITKQYPCDITIVLADETYKKSNPGINEEAGTVLGDDGSFNFNILFQKNDASASIENIYATIIATAVEGYKEIQAAKKNALIGYMKYYFEFLTTTSSSDYYEYQYSMITNGSSNGILDRASEYIIDDAKKLAADKYSDPSSYTSSSPSAITALLQKVKDDIAEVPTKVQIDALKAELNAYKNAEIANEVYRTAEVASINAKKEEGCDDIDYSDTIEDATGYLTAAKADIDALKTAAELDAEELEKAKEDAIAELTDYKSSVNYRSAESASLTTIKTDGCTAINAATTTAEVATALANAKAEIDALKTAAELDAAELEKAKEDAIAELTGYKSSVDYRSAEVASLTTIKTEGCTAINAATTTAEVATALVNAKTDIDALKTAAELDAEEAAALELANTFKSVIDLDGYQSKYNGALDPSQSVLEEWALGIANEISYDDNGIKAAISTFTSTYGAPTIVLTIGGVTYTAPVAGVRGNEQAREGTDGSFVYNVIIKVNGQTVDSRSLTSSIGAAKYTMEMARADAKGDFDAECTRLKGLYTYEDPSTAFEDVRIDFDIDIGSATDFDEIENFIAQSISKLRAVKSEEQKAVEAAKEIISGATITMLISPGATDEEILAAVNTRFSDLLISGASSVTVLAKALEHSGSETITCTLTLSKAMTPEKTPYTAEMDKEVTVEVD